MHGILGQRAHAPRSPDDVREANRKLSVRMARGLVAPYYGDEEDEEEEGQGEEEREAEAEPPPVEEEEAPEEQEVKWSGSGAPAPHHPCHPSPVAPAWRLLAPHCPKRPPPSLGAGAAAGSLGRAARLAAEKYGLQGEGALEGSYKFYRLARLHSHDFRFARFNCSDRVFDFDDPRRPPPPPAPLEPKTE